MSKIDFVYQEVTDKLIEIIESGHEGWSKMWDSLTIPANIQTGKKYNGSNIVSLYASSQSQGFELPLWASYKQWRSLGCKLKPESSPTRILYVKRIELEEDGDSDDLSEKFILITNYSNVFNIAQIEAWQENEKVCARAESMIGSINSIDTEELDPMVDSLIVNSKADIRTSNKAYFSVKHDYIGMPALSTFSLSEDDACNKSRYYSVLLHEFTHWTGHSSRLNRNFGLTPDSEEYAFEELVAEIGSAFLCAKFGFTNNSREDHAGYLAHYLKILKGDNRAIFKAAALAQKSSDFLLEFVQPKIDPLKAA